MLDRRRTRTDFLDRVVRRLEWSDRVDVLTQDAAQLKPGQASSRDAVVARGFGPPEMTLGIAARWLAPGGVIVISEPPVELNRRDSPNDRSGRCRSHEIRRVALSQRSAGGGFPSHLTAAGGVAMFHVKHASHGARPEVAASMFHVKHEVSAKSTGSDDPHSTIGAVGPCNTGADFDSH